MAEEMTPGAGRGRERAHRPDPARQSTALILRAARERLARRIADLGLSPPGEPCAEAAEAAEAALAYARAGGNPHDPAMVALDSAAGTAPGLAAPQAAEDMGRMFD